MATHTPFTYTHYLQLPADDGSRYQVPEGELVKEPAPYVQHQRVSRRLQRALEEYVAQVDPMGEVFAAPIEVTLLDTNVVQPDPVRATNASITPTSPGWRST